MNLVKGETSCNRTDCQAPLFTDEHRYLRGRWWNTSTRKWYCRACAIRINRACLEFHDPVLCFEEGYPEFDELPKEDKPC